MSRCLLFCGCLLFATGTVLADGPTAVNPLTPPLFTLDPNSPEVAQDLFVPGDLIENPGPAGPAIAFQRENLGLHSDADVLAAVTVGPASPPAGTTFVLIFSVDRAAVGREPPDPTLAALGLPFNMLDQAQRRQAASDAFMSLMLFNRGGPVPPPNGLITGSLSTNNTLVINGGDAGGVDFSISPEDVSPADPNASGNQSNVNGGSGTQAGGNLAIGDKTRDVGVFFSLRAGSPSLATLPGTASPADIYVDLDPNAPTGQFLYAAPDTLGLLQADDIDALLVFDNGDNVFTSGQDQIIFSLAPGSPSLAGNGGPGTLFTSTGFGVFSAYAPASVLGLMETDNVTMLDSVPCDDALACAQNWAIGYLACANNDLDGDGDVDLADLAILLAAYGTCAGDAGYLPEADFDESGCIDLGDLAELLAHYNCGV